jgi:hypothetical protein
MATKLHKEKQYFNDKAVFGLLGLGAAAALGRGIFELFSNNSSLVHSLGMLAIACLLGAILYGLVQLKLKVTVSEKSIKYKLYPFHAKAQKIRWEDVEDCCIVKTPKAAEWHGASVRYNGESRFSLAGRNGLRVKTKDGDKYFIGCSDVDGLQKAMQSFSVG